MKKNNINEVWFCTISIDFLNTEIFGNYSDPLCYVENLLIIGGYKDDFNGLRDSLICA